MYRAAPNLRQQRRPWIALRREDLVKSSNLPPGAVRPPTTLFSGAGDIGAGAGGAARYVTGGLVGARAAAFVDGATSHAVEFEDIYRHRGYRSGSPSGSATPAMAQDIGASGRAFDRAVIAGHDVGCRLALGLQPSRYAMWRIIGAAAAGAVARLRPSRRRRRHRHQRQDRRLRRGVLGRRGAGP
ncbi:MAG: 2-methylcitrate dehydratase PrpD [Paracoccaceae bacterium]|jgi:2-methylcitrate dehydratase PrpD